MDAQTIAERADASRTMLMAFFQRNAQNGPDILKYLYDKIKPIGRLSKGQS